jgi:hypothetical protein
MSEIIVVTLDNGAIAAAYAIGTLRHVVSVALKQPDKHGLKPQAAPTKHIIGAAGEIAVAKHLDKYWPASVCTYKGPDLGEKIQVRTRSAHWAELTIRKDDDPQHAFVLVTCEELPEMHIRGFLWGHEVQEEWFRSPNDRPPAYFVPQEAIRPMWAKKA